jgi:transcription elongation factor GreB
MSRAFVKEQDGNLPEDEVPERPQSAHPNYVTLHGLAKLRQQHHALAEKYAKMSASDSDDALFQREKREVERDLTFLQGRLERAIPVDPAGQPADEVRFGALVTVREKNKTKHEFYIVGEDEADVTSGKVSYVSPLAQAMIGAQVGERVTWHRPAGDAELEIVAIRYPRDEAAT